jgi:hypothetical protein
MAGVEELADYQPTETTAHAPRVEVPKAKAKATGKATADPPPEPADAPQDDGSTIPAPYPVTASHPKPPAYKWKAGKIQQTPLWPASPCH